MKNLTKDQSNQKAKIARALHDVGEELADAVNRYNAQMSALYSPIEELQGRYNELILEAQGFLEGVQEEQEAYIEDRSDRWREGDAGQAYSEWADAWRIGLEEVEVYAPEPLDDLVLEEAELILELPDHP